MFILIDSLFLEILNMSVTASFVILAVLVIRLLLIKVPKIFSFALWGIVLFHLLCPFSFESAIGLLPTNQKIVSSTQVVSTSTQMITLPTIEIDEGRAEYNTESGVTVQTAIVIPLEMILAILWIIGMASMILFAMIQFVKLKKKLIGATPLARNIYIADHIDSPFVMGLIRPIIYLPSNISEMDKTFIILHEQTHIKRLDHITRILGFMALVLHWFNPLVWLAFVLSGKDMELSCDESVMKKMKEDVRVAYSEILLRFATGKQLVTATLLAFGDGDTKSRVKNIMKYKKPVAWVSGMLVVFVGVVVIALTSNSDVSSFAKGVVPITATITEIDRVNHTMKVAPLDSESPLHEGIMLDIQYSTFTKDKKENSIADFSVGYLVDVYVNMTNTENDTVYPLRIDMKNGTSATAVDHVQVDEDIQMSADNMPTMSSGIVASKVAFGEVTPFALPVELVDELVFNALIQSALFDNKNVATLDSYYHFKGEVFGEEKEIFIYVGEEMGATLQFGESGDNTTNHDARSISNDLYHQVEAIFDSQQEAISESKTLVGYIYIQDDVVMIDGVEIVTRDDEKRIDELQLVEEIDYPSGYYIHNESNEMHSYALIEDTRYIFTDYAQRYVDKNVENRIYETQNLAEFIEGSSYQHIPLEEIESHKHDIPYFVEVIDGVAVSITEKFPYIM